MEQCCDRLPFLRNDFQRLSASSHSLRLTETVGVTTCFAIKSWDKHKFDVKGILQT